MARLLAIPALVLVLGLVPGAASAAPAVVLTDSRVRVVDGDTIELGGEIIRLHGIDAPERAQHCRTRAGTAACGEAASEFLSEVTRGHRLRCVATGRDRYGRWLASCTVGAGDLGALLVRAGWALAYRRYDDRYVGDEAIARQRRAGLWAFDFDEPWAWRAAATAVPGGTATEVAAASTAGTCRIKGNISRSGERIYHVPGQEHYERTRIDEMRGERWFCSRAEAEAGGWRAAAR